MLSQAAVNEYFKLQTTSFDFYNAFAGVWDTRYSSVVEKVAILRVFGTIPSGHTVCVHVHNYLPYMFIQLPRRFKSRTEAEKHAEFLCAKLEELMWQKQMKNSAQKEVTSDSSKRRKVSKKRSFIASVELCRAVPVYGFSLGNQIFYKITYSSPYYKNRLLDILNDTDSLARINLPFAPKIFESHISFELQFMADFNLHGCEWMMLNKCHFRSPIYNTNDVFHEMKLTEQLIDYINKFRKHKDSGASRLATTYLEVDICASDILNRLSSNFEEPHTGYENSTSLNTRNFPQLQEIWLNDKLQRQMRGLKEYSSGKKHKRTIVPSDITWESQLEHDVLLQQCAELSRKSLGDTDKDLDLSHILKEPEWIKSLPPPSDLVNDCKAQYPDYKRAKKGEFSAAIVTKAPSADSATFNATNYSDSTFIANSSDSSKLNTKSGNKVVTNVFQYNAFKFISPPKISKMRIEYREPFYSTSKDIPEGYIYNNHKFKFLDHNNLPAMTYRKRGISKEISSKVTENKTKRLISANDKVLKLGYVPFSKTKLYKYTKQKPTYEELKTPEESVRTNSDDTLNNKSSNTSKSLRQLEASSHCKLSMLSIEVHISCNDGSKVPDPAQNEIKAIFWKVSDCMLDLDVVEEGIIIHGVSEHTASLANCAVEVVQDEREVVSELISLVALFDPDLLVGYEVHNFSWGYIINRFKAKYDIDLLKKFARTSSNFTNDSFDSYGFSHASKIRITGRYVINCWRHVSHDVALSGYSIENVVSKVLKQRIPYFSRETLTTWISERSERDRVKFFNYYMQKVRFNIELLKHLDVVFRTVEQARIGGIDFHSVFYRGSQFKVESFLLRICKSKNYLMLAPSKAQVRKQKPLERIPLVMEPTSQFYKDPLVILDFQSLYPSLIIAYNYCYSTCLGRLRNFTGTKAGMGVLGQGLRLQPGLLDCLYRKEDVIVSPNGVVFCKPHVRKSVIAQMVDEILSTRFLLKDTMKHLEGGSYNLYDNRQLALKLVANVIYGYTSASFSGRMPCSDIADAIVQSGRETLVKAITTIESHPDWDAKVVYGDTDSLFISLQGRTVAEAFKIGKSIGETITALNPDPVTLKFEKVYHPSVLLTKKRYVGYCYESESQKEPKFEAKGIETVRRDGIPAQQKILEQSLRIMFEKQDLSLVKKYVMDQFTKLLTGDVSVQDYCFAKEVKLGNYQSEQTMPAGAYLVKQKQDKDANYEPEFRERVPYLIVKNDSVSRLKDRAMLLEDYVGTNLELDGEYYINKVLVPPLERVFNFIGADIKKWVYELPKYGDDEKHANTENENLLQKYLRTSSCINCGAHTNVGKLCDNCRANEAAVSHNMMLKCKAEQLKYRDILSSCRKCLYRNLKDASGEMQCESLDCPRFYARSRSKLIVEKATEAFSWIT